MAKMGRPTKYKKKFCQELILHMQKGLSFETFAAVIDVNVDTVYEWAQKHKDFSDAKSIAYNKCRLFWESEGIKGLYSTTMRKGNVSHSKTMNAHVWSLNLRARFKEWRNVDKPEINVTNDSSKLIIKMTNEDE